jgi:hypothetical protein
MAARPRSRQPRTTLQDDLQLPAERRRDGDNVITRAPRDKASIIAYVDTFARSAICDDSNVWAINRNSRPGRILSSRMS